MKALDRPIRASMIIATVKKLPEEEAAAICYDELKSALVEMGIDIGMVVGMKEDPLAAIRKVKGLSDVDAFRYLVRLFKRRLQKLGADRSVIRGLRFE